MQVGGRPCRSMPFILLRIICLVLREVRQGNVAFFSLLFCVRCDCGQNMCGNTLLDFSLFFFNGMHASSVCQGSQNIYHT